MIATTWRAATYGVRVGRENAQRFFARGWTLIEVKIEGQFHVFSLSPTFWTKCPEFRGGPLPGWFARHGLDTWPRGQPHRLVLTPLGENRFELSMAETATRPVARTVDQVFGMLYEPGQAARTVAEMNRSVASRRRGARA